MLAVHWTPVNRIKNILKDGITKSRQGLYCFPLTGHQPLDRWWLHFFNQCKARQNQKYIGVVFRIEQQDLPAYFGIWIGATNRDDFAKKITTMKQLKEQFKHIITWRLGELLAQKADLEKDIVDHEKRTELYQNLVAQEIKNNPRIFISALNDLDFMRYTLDDYQIVLTHSIPADRIIKLIPQGTEFGRVKRLKEKHRI